MAGLAGIAVRRQAGGRRPGGVDLEEGGGGWRAGRGCRGAQAYETAAVGWCETGSIDPDLHPLPACTHRRLPQPPFPLPAVAIYLAPAPTPQPGSIDLTTPPPAWTPRGLLQPSVLRGKTGLLLPLALRLPPRRTLAGAESAAGLSAEPEAARMTQLLLLVEAAARAAPAAAAAEGGADYELQQLLLENVVMVSRAAAESVTWQYR